jgi:hypothetical protein
MEAARVLLCLTSSTPTESIAANTDSATAGATRAGTPVEVLDSNNVQLRVTIPTQFNRS